MRSIACSFSCLKANHRTRRPFPISPPSIILYGLLLNPFFLLIPIRFMPAFPANLQPLRFWLLCLMAGAIGVSTPAVAQESDQEQAQKTPGIVSVDVGFNSIAKLGKWQPVLITTTEIEPTRFAITALDGNANKAVYSGNLTQVGDNAYQAWVCIGRTYGNLEIELLDSQDQHLASRTIVLESSEVDVVASTAKQTVTIGAEKATNSALSSTVESLYGNQSGKVIGLTEAKQLPVHWFGYDGVNDVFLFGSDKKRIEEISEQQWQALETWVINGGRLFISSNGKDGVLSDEGPLARFNVGKFSEVMTLKSMVQLDKFTRKRLDAKSLPVARIEVSDGKIDLAQKGNPLIVRQSRGLGQIVFISFDLADPVLSDWQGQPVLFSQLLESRFSEQSNNELDSGGSRASHLGYTDLSGQLKGPLEKFSRVRLISFTMVAVLIGIYLLLIGPGDFFLLKKVFRKMEMTWLTFSLITLGFSALAIGLASWSRPHSMQINQLEIIDIDATSGRFHGHTWTKIFSPETRSQSLSFDTTNDLGLKSDSQLCNWLGSPGDGLGGMQTKAGLTTGQGSYEIVSQQTEVGQVSTSLQNLPLQVSSSSAFLTQWSGTFEPRIESRLRYTGVQLEGQITNPLDKELINVRILFDDYIYILDKKLGPYETLDILSGPRVRTLKTYMTGRKRTSENNDRGQNAPWDPASTDLPRIADMMMFYSAAGGKDYTSLTHQFHNRIEMKDQMYFNRAVLVGELESNVGRFSIDGQSSDEFADRQLTLVRILLPVVKAR